MKNPVKFSAQLAAQNLTIIVPAYNEENSIADTVRSLIAQTTPPHAVVVIDDCSTDTEMCTQNSTHTI